jgi:hypothetical protein
MYMITFMTQLSFLRVKSQRYKLNVRVGGTQHRCGRFEQIHLSPAMDQIPVTGRFHFSAVLPTGKILPDILLRRGNAVE